jgi:AraC-like DNA-binding protein
MTVHRYVTQVKMAEAKRLMEITHKSVAEISEYLGFSSQSYFQRVFKKQYGITPGKFRKGE